MSPLVQSPWSAPRKAADAPAPATAVDRLETSSAAAAPQTKSARPPVWRSVLLGLSVAGSLIGGTAGTALAQPATAVAQTVRTTDRDALVEEILTAPNSATHPSAADLDKARASLRQIPVPALQLLARNGTHLVILGPHQTPLDAGVVRPVDLHAYDNPAPLIARANEALQRTDRIYADRIAALEKRVDDLQAHEQGDETSPALQRAENDVERLRSERDAIARRAVQEATDGLLEPAMTEEASQMGRLARVSPVSLRDLAEGHGAQNDAQVNEYAALVGSINGGARIAEAEKMYGVNEPSTAAVERPMMAYDAHLLVPAFKYDGGRRLTSYDLEAIQTWRDNAARGQYFYRGDINTVLVRSDALGPQEDGHDVVQHEMGHAFEDAKATLEPQTFAAYETQRDAAFARLAANPHHPYHGGHFGEAPGEMAAQTFADEVAHKDGALRKADAAWLQAFDAWSGSGAR